MTVGKALMSVAWQAGERRNEELAGDIAQRQTQRYAKYPCVWKCLS